MKSICMNSVVIAISIQGFLSNYLGAQPLNQEFDPVSKVQISTVPYQTTPNKQLGTLSIFTDPPGVDIYLDGNRIESSPITLEVSSGEHHIRITFSGWKDEECIVAIQNDKKTVITALMRKPAPTKMIPQDIGRVYKEELSFEDFEKEEIEYTYLKPTWPKTAKKFSILVMAVGAITAMATLKDTNFSNERNSTTQVVIASLGLGMVGTVIFYVVDENSGYWVDKPVEENIEYNKKKKQAIENHNQEAQEYNQKTRQLLTDELTKRQNEINKFNQNRGLTIETN